MKQDRQPKTYTVEDLQKLHEAGELAGMRFSADELSNEVYHASPGISKSGLDLIHKSPLDYKYAVLDGNRRPPTPSMLMGTWFHLLILEPERFAQDCIEYVPETGAGSRAANAAFKEDHADKHLITVDQWSQLHDMRDRVMQHKHASLFADGEPEVSVFWRDNETGVLCKARFDYLKWIETESGKKEDRIPFITDLKTVATATRHKIERGIADYRYYVQDPFYRDGCEAVLGKRPLFAFFFVETAPPYGARVVSINQDGRELGLLNYRRDLKLYADCMALNEWPSFKEDIQEFEVPAYVYYSEGV